MEKKAEMGVGTLLVFIAMLLVASVAAGVIIHTQATLQQKSVSTSQQARDEVSTHLRTYEISATDASNGNVTDFEQIVKLTPGSEPMKLNGIVLSFSTKDGAATLEYRGTDSRCEKDNSVGYNTWGPENIGKLENFQGFKVVEGETLIGFDADSQDIYLDLDDDGINDTARVCDGTNCGSSSYDGNYIMVNLSTAGEVLVHLVNDDGSEVDLSEATSGFNFTHIEIEDYGFIKGWRSPSSTSNSYEISPGNKDVYFQFFKAPVNLDEDYNDDGADDYLAVNCTHALLFLGWDTKLEIPLGENICTASTPIELNVDKEITYNSKKIATLEIDATIRQNGVIPAHDTVRLTPYRLNEGYFSAVYETKGTSHFPGRIQRGDVVKLCYEAPGQITTDRLVRIHLVPRIGTATLSQFVTPEVMSRHRAYLYP
ncbi:MAG: archaellin/type IV pilin N-terminal domain-containing protein [Nanobdellota archaeon]